MIGAADRASFYQLKSILQGVVARGTARAISALSPYVAGKTGTTENSVDGWFVGFTNDVTIAVWVGYDNGDGKRRSLGAVDGARVALPIFKPIIEDIWADNIAPKTPLSRTFARGAAPACRPADRLHERRSRTRRAAAIFIEHFRIGPDGESPIRNISSFRPRRPLSSATRRRNTPTTSRVITRVMAVTGAARRVTAGDRIIPIRAGSRGRRLRRAVSLAIGAIPAISRSSGRCSRPRRRSPRPAVYLRLGATIPRMKANRPRAIRTTSGADVSTEPVSGGNLQCGLGIRSCLSL